MRVALIDADAMIYVIGSKYAELGLEAVTEVQDQAEDFLRSILGLTNSDMYLGFFSCSTEQNFRSPVYNYAPYKGNRQSKPEWYLLWEPVIKEFLINNHGFYQLKRVEADDALAWWSEIYTLTNVEHVICSPDKDLDQIAGTHYAYSKEGAMAYSVTPAEARFNLHLQILKGDNTDNIKGIPGMRDVKAEKVLREADPMTYGVVTVNQYVKYFGEYYGPLIHSETKATVQLLTTKHEYGYLVSEEPKITLPNVFTASKKGFNSVFGK